MTKLDEEIGAAAKEHAENWVIPNNLSQEHRDALSWSFSRGAHWALAKSEARVEKLREALEFYAAYPGNKFKTKWDEDHVCDSWSGVVPTFDYCGSLADSCDEVARKALAKIGGAE